MRKLQIVLSLMIAAALFTSCTAGTEEIVVVTREDGSGTRAAFAELLDYGKNTDITSRAEVVNTNAVMLFSVAGCDTAIGYVSAGAMAGSVKSVSIDGVFPTFENIRSGAYSMKRSFHLVEDGNTSDAARDFIAFTRSSAAGEIISETGYVPPEGGDVYVPSGKKGKIVLAGSTSVAPLIEKLADAYENANSDVHIEVQQTGSSAGISSVLEGVADIGMSSRELTDTEMDSGLSEVTIAYDGIAVIVHQKNPVIDLSLDQVRRIFAGQLTMWQAVYNGQEG